MQRGTSRKENFRDKRLVSTRPSIVKCVIRSPNIVFLIVLCKWIIMSEKIHFPLYLTPLDGVWERISKINFTRGGRFLNAYFVNAVLSLHIKVSKLGLRHHLFTNYAQHVFLFNNVIISVIEKLHAFLHTFILILSFK